jgi:hypothetical protein
MSALPIGGSFHSAGCAKFAEECCSNECNAINVKE